MKDIHEVSSFNQAINYTKKITKRGKEDRHTKRIAFKTTDPLCQRLTEDSWVKREGNDLDVGDSHLLRYSGSKHEEKARSLTLAEIRSHEIRPRIVPSNRSIGESVGCKYIRFLIN